MKYEKIYDCKDPKSRMDSGSAYTIPYNMETTEFYNLICEFVNLAKEKGLTVRQAQYLFLACSDYVLDSKLIDDSDLLKLRIMESKRKASEYAQSAAESAENGILYVK